LQEAPFSLGNPGEDVPTIDVADLKSLWSIYRDMETRNPGKRGAVGIGIIRDACSAGADIGAVLYRGSMLDVLEMCPGELLARWKRSGEFDEVVFRVAATIPMKWVEGGVPQSHLPFDVDAFIQELQKESP
jgi:hypothetical protein